MPSQDTIFHTQIKPLMDQIFELCEQHDIDLVAAFAVNDGDEGNQGLYVSAITDKDSYAPMKMASLILAKKALAIPIAIPKPKPNGAVH